MSAGMTSSHESSTKSPKRTLCHCLPTNAPVSLIKRRMGGGGITFKCNVGVDYEASSLVGQAEIFSLFG